MNYLKELEEKLNKCKNIKFEDINLVSPDWMMMDYYNFDYFMDYLFSSFNSIPDVSAISVGDIIGNSFFDGGFTGGGFSGGGSGGGGGSSW